MSTKDVEKSNRRSSEGFNTPSLTPPTALSAFLDETQMMFF
jgi:hypothetical protein